ERTRARRQHQVANRLRVAAPVFGKANRRVIAPLADEDLTDGAAPDAELDQVRNIRDIDAVARRGRPIDLDGDLGKRRKLIDIEHNVGGAGYVLENPDDVLADPAHLIEIV